MMCGLSRHAAGLHRCIERTKVTKNISLTGCRVFSQWVDTLHALVGIREGVGFAMAVRRAYRCGLMRAAACRARRGLFRTIPGRKRCEHSRFGVVTVASGCAYALLAMRWIDGERREVIAAHTRPAACKFERNATWHPVGCEACGVVAIRWPVRAWYD
jgi:hypothetical protein